MSGYLQRLARNAVQRVESSVRPLVGSMFSPPEYSEVTDSLPVEEHLEAAAQQAPSLPIQAIQDAPETREFSVRSDAPMLESSLAAEPQPTRSSFPPAESSKLLQPLRVEQIPIRLPGRLQQIGNLPHEEAPREKQRFTPLISERPGRTEPSGTSANSLGTRGAATATSQRMNVSRPALREPDEIQIHIGRIEVTAVPQGPARAAIRPARKGQSLEEYLNQRDRRA